ncbi:uncharacterized protein [Lepisosteus oculatus]|uniref:uncharacterized protein isoform X6 n=1 Tax=Lepisosteus oculatus TaxID=7918 RepID=UPI0035F51432
MMGKTPRKRKIKTKQEAPEAELVWGEDVTALGLQHFLPAHTPRGTMERGGPVPAFLLLTLLVRSSRSGLTHHSVPEGDPVTLECGMSNPPSPSELLQWTVTPRGGPDHTVVTRHEDGHVVKGVNDPQNRFSLLDDSSLLIWSVKPGDAGLYSCNRQPVADLQVTTGDPVITEAPGTESPGPGRDAGDDTATGNTGSPTAAVVAAVASPLCALVLLLGLALLWRRSRRRRAAAFDPGATATAVDGPPAAGAEAAQSTAGQVDDVQGEGEVHYASLGHQGKRDPRPRAQDADSSVVYSSVARRGTD